ncbi:hypothetical protein EC957_007093 [Mortierella hygrophila]|uniref:Uncharacterized protein n=1 Tax=Mortierella hygrophila TaxID=979708 RepID=A0A9P6EYV4_9FUNG|nr:hypothetical protein EC957_007093 [Mortierella hygrophila]
MVHEGVVPPRAMVPVSAKAQLTPPTGLVLDSPLIESSRVSQQQEQKQEPGHDQALTGTNNAQVPPPAASTSLEDVDSSLTPGGQDIRSFPSSIISSFFMSLPNSEPEPEPSSYLDPLEKTLTEAERIPAATGVSEEAAADMEALWMFGSEGENMNAVDGSDIFIVLSNQDQSDDKKANVVLPMANERVSIKSPVPMHLYPDAPKSALKILPPGSKDQQRQGQKLEQDKRDSVVAGQTYLKVGGQEEDQDKDALTNSQTAPSVSPPPPPFGMPALDPISIVLMGASEPGQQNQNEQQHQQEPEAPLLPWSKPPPNFPPSVAAIIATSASAASTNNPAATDPFSTIFVHRDPNRTLGYNLKGIHWILYLVAQGLVIFLLVVLFLGVLILTEFVLDREDEDLVQIQYLYWSRVVGIASATIVSAVHGSLLSGYVLLEEHTDWIAKAAVGAIVVYWVSMAWIMNRMTGPLPY